MPYIKTEDGKWITGTLRRKDGGDLRLLLVDHQVDHQGVLAKAALPNVVVVEFDSAKDGLNDVLQSVRNAHADAGKPFVSVALANHGGQEWRITTDLIVSMANNKQAIAALRPLMDTLVAVVDKTDFAKSHIDILACSLAKTQPDFVPTLEKMYKVDFRASTDDTGNASQGGDWKLETDQDYDFAKSYLDPVKKEQYVEVMNFLGNVWNGICDAGAALGNAVAAPVKATVALAQGDLAGAGDAVMDGVGGVAMVASGGASIAMGIAMEAAIDTVLEQLPSSEAQKIKALRQLKNDVKAAKRGRIDKLPSLLRSLKSLGVSVPGY